MKTWLKIGAVVQVLITSVRIALGKVQGPMKELYESKSAIGWVVFITICPILMMINVILWPVAIIAEIYNTIKKI